MNENTLNSASSAAASSSSSSSGDNGAVKKATTSHDNDKNKNGNGGGLAEAIFGSRGGTLSSSSSSSSSKPGGTNFLTRFADEQRLERLRECKQLEMALRSCHKRRDHMIRASKDKNDDAAKHDGNNRDGTEGKARHWGFRGAGAVWFFQKRQDPKTTSISASSQPLNQRQHVLDDTKQEEEEDYKHEHETISLDQTKSGMKINRFFKWNTVHDAGDKKHQADYEALSSASQTKQQHQQQQKQPPPSDMSKNISIIPTCAKEAHAVWACRAMALGCAADLVQLRKCFHNTETDALRQHNILSSHDSTYEQQSTIQSGNVVCAQEQQRVGRCVTENAMKLEARMRSVRNEREKGQ